MNKNWTTFDGRKVGLYSIDHQHLSNCYYYLKIIAKFDIDFLIENIQEVLNERFNGQILPYRPHIRFSYEIDYLIENGLIKDTNNPNKKIIVFENNEIGEILTINNL